MREKELIRLADEKIKLSEAVLTDETRNYSFGKITLNDYIDAVITVDLNQFNKILHTVELKKLHLEWFRLTDRLINKTLSKNKYTPPDGHGAASPLRRGRLLLGKI